MREDERAATARTNGQDGDANDQYSRWQRETARALERSDSARIEVYVRSLLPPPGAKESQQKVISALQETVEDTAIGDVLIDVWGERLCLCDECRVTEPGRVFLNRVRELREWGSEYDAAPGSFFERTHREASVTGNSYEGIVPPRVTAALYIDGALSGVFPARFGDERYSVSDFATVVGNLDTLASAVESRG